MPDESALLQVSGPEAARGGDGDESLSVSESEAAPVHADTGARVQLASRTGHRRTDTPLIKKTAASTASSKRSAQRVRNGQFGQGKDHRAARDNASKDKAAFVAYFKRLRPTGIQAETGVKMEPLLTDVYSVTSNDEWFEDMKRRGKQKLGSHELDSSDPNFRWIHLPSNNPEWIKGAMYQILDKVIWAKQHDWENHADFAENVRGQILCDEYWEDQEIKGLRNVYHSRFMKPFCRKMSKMPDSAAKIETNKHLVFLMPYVHWELSGRHAAMTNELQRTIQGVPALDGSTDAELLHAYLSGPDSMHIRRTLDQSYYSTMSDTSARDQDQVTQRYAAEKSGKGNDERPMLMVDQCWLWIIGGDTILTAFPQQWSGGSAFGTIPDETDVFGGIWKELQKKHFLDQVTDVKTLAYLIIDRCACNVYDPESIKNPDMQFLRQFDESIDNLMVDQTESLKQLWADVRKSKGPGIDDSMFDMTEDFGTLEKIKDIMEEISMLTHVQNQQNKALKLLESEEIYPLEEQMFDLKSVSRASHPKDGKALHDDGSIEPQIGPSISPASPSNKSLSAHFPTAVDANMPGNKKAKRGKRGKRHKSPRLLELLRRAEERKANLALLAEKAKSSYKALHDLLDLKQRQARLSEAKQARRSAQELEEQSNSIMLFTIVTILFLPFSSLASMFGINAVEFGQGTHWTLARIFVYLFPLSTFIAGFTFVLAFNQNIRRILALWMAISGTWLLLWFPTASVNHYVDELQRKLDRMQAKKTKKGEARVQNRVKWRAMREDEIEKVDEIIAQQWLAKKADRRKARKHRSQHPTGNHQADSVNDDIAANIPSRPVQEDEDGLANGLPKSSASIRSKARVHDEEQPPFATALAHRRGQTF